MVVWLFKKFSTTLGVNCDEYIVRTTIAVENVNVAIVIKAPAIIPRTVCASEEVV
jgi:hypothetical protein